MLTSVSVIFCLIGTFFMKPDLTWLLTPSADIVSLICAVVDVLEELIGPIDQLVR